MPRAHGSCKLAPRSVSIWAQVACALLWVSSMSSFSASADSQPPGGAKQWLHDAIKKADEAAVRSALSQGNNALVNTPDQCTNACT